MQPRSRWQALQARIAAARAALEAGDRTRALQEVDAALEIDPNFLAAQALKDRIAAAPLAAAPAVPFGVPTGPAPIVSAERYARFEERARRRRVDRRLDAARMSISDRRWKDAAAALDEIAELDPNLPELAELNAQIAQMRHEPDRRRRYGPPLAAAAVFAALLLGASWVEQTAFELSRPIAPAPEAVAGAPPQRASVSIPEVAAPLESAPAPAAMPPNPLPPPRISNELEEPPRDSSARAQESTVVAALRDVPPAPAPPTPVADPAKATPRPVLPPPAADPSAILPQTAVTAPPVQQASNTRTAPEPEPVRVPDRTAPPARPAVDEEALVREALQRYRAAYEGLDARSAQAVWPAVNEEALARAFDGLESQRLTFDACNVQMGVDRAAATCRGTARYVPKVGSRDMRTEPRTWTFALVKAGPEWKIDAARVER